MGKKKVTLKDIAEQTGFSVNTVSLALKGVRVSEKTQKVVIEVAEELGYIGNAHASSMRTGQTGCIAIIVGDVANPYHSAIIKDTVNIMSGHKYSTIIYNTDELEELERKSIISALRQEVDGILIAPVVGDGPNLRLLKESGVPFVVFGGTSKDPTIDTVCLDDEKGGYLATKYLLERGHRDIVFINGPQDVQCSINRLGGYKRALEEVGIPFDEAKVLNCAMNHENTSREWEQIKYQLHYVLKYTAVIAYRDLTAMQIYSILNDSGISNRKVDPADIVGFDNIMATFPLPVKIPSVGAKEIRVSTAAPERLLELLREKDQEAKRIILDVKVYVP